MDQKGHIIDQKGLKMYEKKTKMEFLHLKYPSPVNGKSSCPKTLSGKGGYPPLNGQNPLSSS